jgi:hypothetical protein
MEWICHDYNKTEEIEKMWMPLFDKRGIDLKFDVVLDN